MLEPAPELVGVPAPAEPSNHQRFTVDSTAYLRNLDREDLHAKCIAIFHQAPPTVNENGSRNISLRFPMLVVALYLDEPRDVADRVAAILSLHWERYGEPDPRDAVVAAAHAVMARYQSEAFLRTVDCHRSDCQCRRCEFDALEAALGGLSGHDGAA